MSYKILKTNYIYFTGLVLLVAGLPVSLFLTSLSQFFLAAAFLFEGNPLEKFKRFFKNKTALFFAGIWIFHLLGILWTNDLAEGMKDLRIKLPLLILPLIIGGSKPLTKKQFGYVLAAFVGAIVIGTLISMAVLTGIIPRKINDIRDVFIFNISHIRFALFTCLGIFILIEYGFRKKDFGTVMKFLFFILIAWLIAFLFIVESVTGIIILLLTVIILLIVHFWRTSGTVVRIMIAAMLISLPFIFRFSVNQMSNVEERKTISIDYNAKTSQGNTYDLDINDTILENGYPVWVYVSDKELRETWNKRSSIPYDSLDERQQPVRFTIVRFLASKGLRKDAEGLNSLNEDEIKSIERGVANVNYQDISSMKVRVLEITWEIDQFMDGGNPSGHSVTQRFEFWKAAGNIAKANFFFGVGTGDMKTAYADEYVKMNSSLDESHRLRAHNQYLAIMVALGIVGLLYFLFALFFPLFSKPDLYRDKIDFLFAAFFTIAILSMFSEDTLETQAGATFIAFFFSFLLFSSGPEFSAKKHS